MLARQDATDAEIAQWRAAKAAACDAIVAAGGTITHHHAVGRDHAPWLEDEVGELGVEVLRAAKRLDPAGIMNPGKLLRERRSTRPVSSGAGESARRSTSTEARLGGAVRGSLAGGPQRAAPRADRHRGRHMSSSLPLVLEPPRGGADAAHGCGRVTAAAGSHASAAKLQLGAPGDKLIRTQPPFARRGSHHTRQRGATRRRRPVERH